MRGKLIVIASIALALAPAGCGGKEAGAVALTKHANAICTQRALAIRAAARHERNAAVIAQRSLAALERGVLALAALTPPAKLERAYGIFVAEESEQIDRIRAALTGRQLPHSGRRDQRTWLQYHAASGSKLGFSVCIGAGGLPIFK